MVAVSLVLEADFDKDGTYETDLSAFLTERAGGASIVRGASVQGEPREGVMQVTLDNELGTFSIDYDSSPLYGQLEPHVPLRLRGLLNGVPFVAYTGYVSRYRPQYGAKGQNIAQIEAKDLTAHLAGFPLVNLNAAERDTSEAYEAIADVLGIGSLVDADPGTETLPLHFCRNANAMDALTNVTWSEMGGDQFVTADGTLRWLNRHARLGIYEVAHEWGTGTLVQPEKVDPELTDDDLITSCAVQCTVFVADDPTVVLFVFSRGKANPTPDSLFLEANVPYVVQLDFPSPVLSLVDPEENRDYEANSAVDGSGTDQTSSLSVTAELQGAGFELTLLSNTDTYVTFLQLRGLAENEAQDRPVFTHTLSLPNQIMDQGVTLQVPHATDTQALRDYPVAVCRTYRWPYPVVHLDFAWDTDAVALSMLETELWDLVHFTDTGAAEWLTHIDDYFYVVGISHQFVPGQVFRSQMTLAPAHLYFDLDAVVYDNFQREAASGALGTALSADPWSNDSGFDIASGAAVANSASESTPYLRVFDATDQVVEVQVSGMGGEPEGELAGTHSPGDIGSTDTLTISHTVTSGTSVLAVSVETRNGPITGVTFGGVALTEADAEISSGVEASIWYLVNPTAGTDDVVVTSTGAASGIVAGANNLTGIDTANPVRDTATGTGATSVSVAVTTEPGDIVLDALAGPDNGSGNTPTVGANQAALHLLLETDTRGGSSWEAATGTSTTMSWSTLRSENWRYVAVAFRAAAVEPEAGITFRYEDENHHYRAYVDHGSSEVVLEAVVDGVVTEIASPAWVPTAFAEMRAIIQDTRIRVWVGRRKYIDVTDGSWAAGYRAGLFARNASGTARFNHFHGRGI